MKLNFSNPFAAVVAATLVCASNSQAVTRTWDGDLASSDPGWLKKQNWDGGGNNDLAVGSDLIFGGEVGLSPINDFAADSSFASVTFDNTAGAFTLTGARITLTGAVTNNDADFQTINMDLILSGASGTFDTASGSLFVGGVISGSNGLTKSGNNILQLTSANLYTGTTTVSGGTLLANNSIDFLGTGAIGFYKLFDTSTNDTTVWTGLTVDGNGLITAGLTATNLNGALTGKLIMGGNPLGGTSGDIYLHVVPEPSVALLGGIGVMFLFRRRRA